MRILVTGGNGFLGKCLVRKLKKQGHKIEPEKSWNLDINYPFYFKVDQIYNLAGHPDRAVYEKYPELTIKTSTVGVRNVINLACQLDIPIFHASTVRVYDNEDVTPYVTGKLQSEAICMTYKKAKVGRLHGVIGNGMKETDSRVFAAFNRNARSGLPLIVKQNKVDKFCFVEDMIDEIIAFMNSDEYGIKDLGYPFEISILNLAKLIKTTLNSESKIEVMQ